MEETQFCRNCKKDVAASNFSLHEVHCWRHLVLCELCDESIPRIAAQEHQEMEHSLVRCKLCNKDMEKRKLEVHEIEDCSERPMDCKFCELDMPLSKLQEHVNSCGSRTQRCSSCSKYIMYKDLEQHSKVCSPKSALSKDFSTDILCQTCKKSFPEDQLFKHQNDCNPLPLYLGTFYSKSKPDVFKPPRPAFVSPLSSASLFETVRREKDQDHNQEERQFSFFSKQASSFKTSLQDQSVSPDEFGCSFFSSNFEERLPQMVEDSKTSEFEICPRCKIMLPSIMCKLHKRKCFSGLWSPVLTRDAETTEKIEDNTNVI
ncbi:XIAP-associated factor 1 [Latimeria chalumnae]|uniref:XIAP associated factor 1 n=1 Tax=Latimeria chalumnae TaxID=7897 RepID=M3XHW4_LATCH|nr:PREDICTED: XIAP-associated factor 1 [Latimeria chalumnae]XP_005987561.1 PREDICTED: XIAP-associated factor 1 [Latimeria chalumnae]|eukprot:XP_005987560.1 PREDICTED: XIAP-associated factor 1 [Latimeria chalumnae]